MCVMLVACCRVPQAPSVKQLSARLKAIRQERQAQAERARREEIAREKRYQRERAEREKREKKEREERQKRYQREAKEREKRYKKERQERERRVAEHLKEFGIEGPFPSRIMNPKKANLKKGKRYSVWTEQGYHPDGWHSYQAPNREFDSSFSSLKDANARARYVFFYKNCWGIGVDEMFESEGEVEEPITKMNHVSLSLCPNGDSGFWNVKVE